MYRIKHQGVIVLAPYIDFSVYEPVYLSDVHIHMYVYLYVGVYARVYVYLSVYGIGHGGYVLRV